MLVVLKYIGQLLWKACSNPVQLFSANQNASNIVEILNKLFC